MADESNELVRSLNAQLAEANRKLANRTEQAKRLTADKTALTTELAELRTSHATLTTERDTLKRTVDAAPTEKDAEISRLNGELKTRDLRDLFTATAAKGLSIETTGKDGKPVAQTLKVRPDAIGPLLRELKLAPDDKGVLPTEAQITEALKGAATAHPWAYSAGETPTTAADAATQQLTTRAATAGPGTARSVVDPHQKTTAADVVNARFAAHSNGQDGRL